MGAPAIGYPIPSPTVARSTMLVLVTGAAGFLGAHVVRALLQNGDEVRALVRPGRPRNHIRKLGVEMLEGDLQDEGGMTLACSRVDGVIHCAALISYWRKHASQLQRVNVEGTMALLRAAAEAPVRRFVHVSSAGAVGCSSGGEVLDEEAAWEPPAHPIPYIESKRLGEERVLAAAWGGMGALVVNPSLMLGPRLDGKPPSPLITGMMRGKLPWIPPGGVSVTDVTDVAEACVRALYRGRPGERYILSGHNVTWEQLYGVIAEHADGRVPKQKLGLRKLRWLTLWAVVRSRLGLASPPWTPELYRSYGTFTWFRSLKAARELGYAPRPLERIIRHAVRREDP